MELIQRATLPGVDHRTVQVDGAKLHYVIGGEGEPLLLWHGFCETWYAWRKVMPALAQHYTVIARKIRTPLLGLGGSHSKADEVRRQLEEIAHNVEGGAIENCGHFWMGTS
jgi:pimeloyl-ACP methyl ester carboxylesterase